MVISSVVTGAVVVVTATVFVVGAVVVWVVFSSDFPQEQRVTQMQETQNKVNADFLNFINIPPKIY